MNKLIIQKQKEERYTRNVKYIKSLLSEQLKLKQMNHTVIKSINISHQKSYGGKKVTVEREYSIKDFVGNIEDDDDIDILKKFGIYKEIARKNKISLKKY